MATNLTLDPSQPLTPSELVLLNGDKFAKKVMMGNTQLMHVDASVSYSQLAQAILASAILGIESTGNLRLEVRQEKAMLGLRKVNNLYGDTTSHPIEWPDYSLESQLPQIAGRLKKEDKSNQVSNMIYAWLREDSGSPWQATIELVKSGMAQRGMLEASEQKRLKILTVTNYTLPESTKSLAAELPIQPVQQLLANCESNRPDIWDLLVKQIKKAIKDRTEQDDIDFD